MATLNLFPARIAIGYTMQGNNRVPVYASPELLRAFETLSQRVGGTLGDQGVDVFAPFSSGGDDLLTMEMITAPQDQPFMAEMISQPATGGYEAPEIFQGAS